MNTDTLEKRRAYNRAYHQEHREEINAKQRAYRRANLGKKREYDRARTVQRREPMRWSWVLKAYGLSREAYERLLEVQKGVCAVCGQEDTLVRRGRQVPLSVDHDHVTRRVRGLLCSSCNRAVGFLKDDPVRCERAAEYLRRGGPDVS